MIIKLLWKLIKKFFFPLLFICAGLGIFYSWKYSGSTGQAWFITEEILCVLVLLLFFAWAAYRIHVFWDTKLQRWKQHFREPLEEKQRKKRNKQIRKPTTED